MITFSASGVRQASRVHGNILCLSVRFVSLLLAIQGKLQKTSRIELSYYYIIQMDVGNYITLRLVTYWFTLISQIYFGIMELELAIISICMIKSAHGIWVKGL
ncbi:MAG: hypothetical protein OEZ28_15160 [Nitrospinota bacterium]|nr:hypothetical protein [Nitrospinota bacterium]